MANLFSPISRQVYDAFQTGELAEEAQAQLQAARTIMNQYPPAPPLLKALIHRLHDLPYWPVRPPLSPMPEATAQLVLESLASITHSA